MQRTLATILERLSMRVNNLILLKNLSDTSH